MRLSVCLHFFSSDLCIDRLRESEREIESVKMFYFKWFWTGSSYLLLAIDVLYFNFLWDFSIKLTWSLYAHNGGCVHMCIIFIKCGKNYTTVHNVLYIFKRVISLNCFILDSNESVDYSSRLNDKKKKNK